MKRMFHKFLVAAVLFSSLFHSTLGDIRITELLSKVDMLSSRMEEAKFLDRAFTVAALGDRLTELTRKMEGLQRQMATIETSLVSSNRVIPPITDSSQDVSDKQALAIENKVEQYGKKIIEQQVAMRNEVREHVSISRSFKGSLENGINKIFTKLNTESTKSNEGEDEEILGAIDGVKQAVDKCASSSDKTTGRIDDIFTDLLNEWSTAHKQMREIDNKLTDIKNMSKPEINKDAVRIVTARVRKDFQRLEDLEPNFTHAVRVSTHLQEVAASENDQQDSIKMLSRNLSSTLKGLQDSLETRFRSFKEGVNIIDQMLVNTPATGGRTVAFSLPNIVDDITGDIKEYINEKLQVLGEQMNHVLSTVLLDASKTITDEITRLRNGQATLVEDWMSRIQQVVPNTAAEMERNCTELTSKDKLRRDVARMLRNSLGS